MKRLVILGVEIPDNDQAEANFYEWIEDKTQPKFIKTVLNTDHLKEDKVYKSLVNQKKKVSDSLQHYIMENKK